MQALCIVRITFWHTIHHALVHLSLKDVFAVVTCYLGVYFDSELTVRPHITN